MSTADFFYKLLPVGLQNMAMAAAVRRILTEPGLAEKLSLNAHKKTECYDWSIVLPKWENLFDKVLSNG